MLAHLGHFDTKGPSLQYLRPNHRPDICTVQSRYSQAIHTLVQASYLKASTVLSHASPKDKRIKYEAEEKAKISGFPTAKQLREAKESAEARLKRERDEAEKIGMVSKPVFARDEGDSINRQPIETGH
jgi:hypothetical protein